MANENIFSIIIERSNGNVKAYLSKKHPSIEHGFLYIAVADGYNKKHMIALTEINSIETEEFFQPWCNMCAKGIDISKCNFIPEHGSKGFYCYDGDCYTTYKSLKPK